MALLQAAYNKEDSNTKTASPIAEDLGKAATEEIKESTGREFETTCTRHVIQGMVL